MRYCAFAHYDFVKNAGGNRNHATEEAHRFARPDREQLDAVLFERDFLRKLVEGRFADQDTVDVVPHQKFIRVLGEVLVLNGLQIEDVERHLLVGNKLARALAA